MRPRWRWRCRGRRHQAAIGGIAFADRILVPQIVLGKADGDRALHLGFGRPVKAGVGRVDDRRVQGGGQRSIVPHVQRVAQLAIVQAHQVLIRLRSCLRNCRAGQQHGERGRGHACRQLADGTNFHFQCPHYAAGSLSPIRPLCLPCCRLLACGGHQRGFVAIIRRHGAAMARSGDKPVQQGRQIAGTRVVPAAVTTAMHGRPLSGPPSMRIRSRALCVRRCAVNHLIDELRDRILSGHFCQSLAHRVTRGLGGVACRWLSLKYAGTVMTASVTGWPR